MMCRCYMLAIVWVNIGFVFMLIRCRICFLEAAIMVVAAPLRQHRGNCLWFTGEELKAIDPCPPLGVVMVGFLAFQHWR